MIVFVAVGAYRSPDFLGRLGSVGGPGEAIGLLGGALSNVFDGDSDGGDGGDGGDE